MVDDDQVVMGDDQVGKEVVINRWRMSGEEGSDGR